MFNKAVECYNTDKFIESEKWYLKAAKAGHKESMCKAGVICRGKGRYDEALEWFHKAEHAGVMMAAYWIGYMYEMGEGVERDYKAAFTWYERAANYKVSDAMFELGILYEYGRGVDTDIKQAIDWYQKAIDTGNWGGHEGGTVASGNAEALEKIKKLKPESAMQSTIEKGIVLYEKGEYGEALSCFKEAAEAGESEAMTWIGTMYEEGKCVGRDYNKAFDWYINAANRGDAIAMNNLGVMYYEGRGIAVSLKCARNWFEKSIKAGNADAKENMKIVENYLRNRNQERKERYQQKKSSGCFITTAVCGSFGKSDDCYELTVFRNFRDNWLSCQPDGASLIAEYYEVAPTIVKKIDSLREAKTVYADIWSKYLSKCLVCIEQGNNLRCKEIYADMVHALQKRFLVEK